MSLDKAVLEEGAGIYGLYLEGARWDRASQLFPSLHISIFFFFVPLDDSVPEEGAGISSLYLEGARWYSEQGRAYQVFSSLHVTKFFVLCLQTRLFEKRGLAYPVCTEGARWHEEQGRLVQMFTEYYNFLFLFL